MVRLGSFSVAWLPKTAALPISVPLLKKLTVPVGELPATVAVSVTWPLPIAWSEVEVLARTVAATTAEVVVAL